MQVLPIAALAGLALLCAGGAARAQEIETVNVFGYTLNASVQAQAAPTYEGGKRYSLFPGGSLAVTRPWEFDAYTAADDAASFALVNSRRFSFGIAASIRENRGNDDELQGMRNIGWSFETGGFVNVWPTHWMRLHVEGLKGLVAQSGVEVNGGLDLVAHPKYWNLSIGPRFGWGDDRFNGTYFGVTPGEAAASPFGIRPFAAHAGPRMTGLDAYAEYKWRPRWRLTLDASYHRLLGDDAKSPLVRQLGSPDQFSISTGIRFVLGYPAL